MVSTRVCGTLSLGSNPSRHPKIKKQMRSIYELYFWHAYWDSKARGGIQADVVWLVAEAGEKANTWSFRKTLSVL